MSQVGKISVSQIRGHAVPQRALQSAIRRAWQELQARRSILFSPQNSLWSSTQAQRAIRGQAVAISSDHAGCNLRIFIEQILTELGVRTRSFSAPVSLTIGGLDHPIWVTPAVEALDADQAHLRCSRVILCCGSGTGVSIDANVLGHPASRAHNPIAVARSREHNNIEVVTFGESNVVEKGMLEPDDIIKSVILFLTTPFIKDPARYGDRNVQAILLHALAAQRRQLGLQSVVDVPGFKEKLAQCPELADIFVVRAFEALNSNSWSTAHELAMRYIRVGQQSANYQRFLSGLKDEILVNHQGEPELVSCLREITRALA